MRLPTTDWLSSIFCLGGALAALSALPTTALACEDEPSVEARPIERLEDWPEVDETAVKFEIERLRKARTPGMGEEAHVALVEMGSGTAPLLLSRLRKEKNEEAALRIEAVLAAITDARHTRLLANRFDDKQMVIRVWCLERVAVFPDPGVRVAAEAAYSAADKRKRGADPKEVLAAALCCASAGSMTGFEVLIADAEKNWNQREEVLLLALSSLRGPEATSRIAPLLAEQSRKRKLTGLRLLHACGDQKSAVSLVAPFLDDPDSSLLIGAVNALRGIVDGEPPLSRLSAFQAVEEANKWKARL
jgi:hypothetical protein